MGNCLFGGLGSSDEDVIKIITSNGGIMEFYTPITVGSITQEFPGHAIFRSHDLFWKPLPHNEELVTRQSYYLLSDQTVREGHVRSKSIPDQTLVAASYRMSFDYQGMLKRSYTEVLSRYGDHNGNNNNGVWKVKLVISPKQLLEILAQEGRTQELIENVRTVAKCGCSVCGVSSAGFSDQWSHSSSGSRNANSSKNDSLLDF